MWRIVRAEFLYHKFIFILFLGLTPLVVLFRTMWYEEADTSSVMVWVLLFLTVNTWVSLKLKEKRDVLYVLSPLPVWQVGLARGQVRPGTALGASVLHEAAVLVPGGQIVRVGQSHVLRGQLGLTQKVDHRLVVQPVTSLPPSRHSLG